MAAEPPLIAVVGETASGKSKLATDIAQEYDGEIIAADSRSVYKEMDIGTSKPSEDARKKIKHHGIDVVHPDETFTAAQFKQLADSAIKQIRDRGKLPILVGGTGLYVDGVLFDYSFAGDFDRRQRSILNNKTIDELVVIAKKKDISVSSEMLKNKRHLVRAIERGGTVSDDRSQPTNTLIIGLKLPRKIIRYNIESRVEAMFRAGLRREVDELVNRYGWSSEAMTGIGYREFKAYYDGKASISKVKRDIIQSTLQLAKRQRTWFKRNPFIEWFDSEDAAKKRIAEFLTASGYTNS